MNKISSIEFLKKTGDRVHQDQPVFRVFCSNKDKINSISKTLSKALTIIYSLQVSLDFDKSPEISQNLFQMYEFCRQQILKFIKSLENIIKYIV